MKFSEKKDMLRYIGDISQLCGIKDYNYNGGKATGMRGIDVKNGSGLEYTVLPDRGMDIAHCSYKAINLSYIAKVGMVGPQYFDHVSHGWLKSFTAGLLTTCGFTYAGPVCDDNGEELGLHGLAANIPANEVSAATEWIDGLPVMKVKGYIRQAKTVGENIVLCREIVSRYGENKIYINDTIENCGYEKQPLMLIYHINFGFPLLSEKSYIVAPFAQVLPKDETAKSGLRDFNKFQGPTAGYAEQVFIHNLEAGAEGNTFAALVNPEYEIAAVVRFNQKQLKNLIQWKMMSESEYVVGLEPANCDLAGRYAARQSGVLEFIEPFEKKAYHIVIEILEGMAAIKSLISDLVNHT